MADRGTLFLDEVGELGLDVQAKLLRVLQEGEIDRLGGGESIKIDTRIVAATNRDLEAEVAKGNFREDLYYRLNVFPIELPPLRERGNDIKMLVKFFLEKFNRELERHVESVPAEVMERLLSYSWPGNIRELRNVIERAVIISSSSILKIKDPLKAIGYVTSSSNLSVKLDDVERNHISKILHRVDWRIEGKGGAADLLDINPSTLRSRIKKLKLKLKRS